MRSNQSSFRSQGLPFGVASSFSQQPLCCVSLGCTFAHIRCCQHVGSAYEGLKRIPRDTRHVPVCSRAGLPNKCPIVGHQSYQMTPSGICKLAPGVKKGTATSGMDKFTQNAPTTGSTSSPAHRSSIVVRGHVQTQSPCRRQGRQFPTARDSTFWWQGQSQPQSSRAMWQFAIFFVFVFASGFGV